MDVKLTHYDGEETFTARAWMDDQVFYLTYQEVRPFLSFLAQITIDINTVDDTIFPPKAGEDGMLSSVSLCD